MSKPKILVVEDDRMIGESTMSLLKRLGYEPIGLVSTGEKAVEVAKSQNPDLVLMDINLKGEMDGITAAENIRKENDFPIIFITAYTNQELLRRARESFPYGYILKPFTDRDLSSNIEMALYKHRAEKRIRESEKKYRHIFESSRDTIYISTPDGKLLDINPAGRQLLQIEEKDLVDINIPEQFYKNPKDYQAQLRLLRKDGYYQDYNITIVRRDGQERELLDSAVAEKDDRGNILIIRGTMRDVTEMRKLEDQLRQAQKMEALGALAGGIAHDFNNVLTTILGFAQMGEMRAKDEKLRDYFQNIEKSAERAARMTKQILAFSRRQEVDFKIINISKQIKEESKILRRLIPEHIKVEFDMSDEDLHIYADSTALQQILMNLMVNARDAMPDGGKLQVSTEKKLLTQKDLKVTEDVKPGYYVCLSISDTGMGIDKEILPRIFEPFFTTKAPNEGTGLGLSVVHGLVKQHHGFVQVDSEPGMGTTFNVYFPLMEPQKIEEGKDKYFSLPRGKGTILVAEDEVDIRKMSGWILRTLGYKPLLTENGEEAIEIIKRKKDQIDLVISDIIMPGKTGLDVLNYIRENNLKIPVILVTGYSSALIQSKKRIPREVPILKKPYTLRSLGEKIQEALTSSEK